MNKFPIEILTAILSHLHQQDIVECMLVCQHWMNAIRRASPFQRVYLTTMGALTKFATVVQEDRNKGEQVEQLVLDFSIDEDVGVNMLLPFLPNVHNLILKHSYGDCYISDALYLPLHKNIRCVAEILDYSFTYNLLSFQMCSRLTTLWCSDDDGKVIGALTNAPALQHLNIILGGAVLLSTLELIHQNAPNLRSLSIDVLRLDGSDLNYEVSPAPLITTFETEQTEQTFITAEYNMLNYIEKKYPNIARLDYCNVSEGEDEELDELFNTRWIPLLKKLKPQLKKLYTFCDERLVNFLKDDMDTVYPINELCFGGISSLKLNQLTNVDFLHDLEVNLRKPWTFEWLSKLTALKKLEMDCYTYRDADLPNLNDIVSNCPPSLATLKLRGRKYAFNILHVKAANITSLSFQGTTVPNGIDTFISLCFPKLTRLIFSHCNIESKKLSLLITNLSYFELSTSFPETNNEVEVVTRGDGRKRRYKSSYSLQSYRHLDKLKILNSPMYAAIQSRAEDGVNNLPYFTLFCNSLQDIALFND